MAKVPGRNRCSYGKLLSTESYYCILLDELTLKNGSSLIICHVYETSIICFLIENNSRVTRTINIICPYNMQSFSGPKSEIRTLDPVVDSILSFCQLVKYHPLYRTFLQLSSHYSENFCFIIRVETRRLHNPI